VLTALALWLLYFTLWLLLSGYFDVPLLLTCGALSCALTVFIARRVERADPEARPVALWLTNPHAWAYWPWLIGQIALSNLDVARLILDPKLPISPTLIRLRPSQLTELGRVIYANSITLTPGTVTTYLRGNSLQVHALTRAAAQGLADGEMDRRVTALEELR
jgi:multicomponent Na+:H+ antiporter subunit E